LLWTIRSFAYIRATEALAHHAHAARIAVRTEKEMGGAKAATGNTGKAKKVLIVSGRFEGYKESDEEALGGFSQGATGGGKIGTVG